MNNYYLSQLNQISRCRCADRFSFDHTHTSPRPALPTMVTNSIDYAQVERSIGFHGAPMQKVWEGERGDADLPRANVKPDFGVYHTRQKHFAFQDRTKRLRLHQFLARKATILYRKATKFDLRQRQLALGEAEESMATSSSQGRAPPHPFSLVPFTLLFIHISLFSRRRCCNSTV